MSYIVKKNNPLINVKLTDSGRKQLAEGQLDFTFFSLDDGEIDYFRNNLTSLKILGPQDGVDHISHPVPAEKENNESTLYSIPDAISRPDILFNDAKERGFLSNNYEIKNDLTKARGLFVYPDDLSEIVTTNGTTGLTATTELKCFVETDTSVNDSILEGDLLFLEVNDPQVNYDLNPSKIDTQPHPIQVYEIQAINAFSSNGETGYTFTLDRELPLFGNFDRYTSSGKSVAHIFPGGDAVRDYYDVNDPSAYWNDSVLNFSANGQVETEDVPVWNMNIVYKNEIAGLDSTFNKSSSDSLGYNYKGLFNYLFYSEYDPLKTKLAVIHYSNNTINNFYGEGFYENSLQLEVPTLMYHYTENANEIGEIFTCGEERKQIDNKFHYYDLMDQRENRVGKVFIDLKIIVIEDAEIITAMSYKSNRNWTLPQPNLTKIDAGFCSSSFDEGMLQNDEEEIVVTYLLRNVNSFSNSIQCENFARIGLNADENPKDVMVRFPSDSFPFLTQALDGFNAEDIFILYQKVKKGNIPNPREWNYFLATSLIGGDGCFLGVPQINENFQLTSESFVVNSSVTFDLSNEPIDFPFVAVNGIIQNPKKTNEFVADYYETDGSLPRALFADYQYLPDQGNYGRIDFEMDEGSTINPTGKESNLENGDIVQVFYLYGNTVASQQITETIVVPDELSANTSMDDIYIQNDEVYIPLEASPHCGQVYVFYNGQVLSSNSVGNNNYDVEQDNLRIKLNFTPPMGSIFNLIYLNKTTQGSLPKSLKIKREDLVNSNFVIDNYVEENVAIPNYEYDEFVNIPSYNENNKLTFGDESFFFGNVKTKIKATVFSTQLNLRVLPGKFTTSNNPSFNSNLNTVAFSGVGIYDSFRNLVGIGKFSEPITRKSDAETLIISVNIDF